MYTFIIILIAACLAFYAAMAFIFYKAMKVNQQGEKKVSSTVPAPQPPVSRPTTPMEQKRAHEAGLFHVLPISEGDVIYSVTSVLTASSTGEAHYAAATHTTGKELWKTQFYVRDLETDVQNFFIEDLYITGQHVCIKPEHGSVITIDKQTGQLLTL